MNKDLEIIKKPFSSVNYTQDDLADLIRCMDDPIFFIEKFVKVQHPTKGMVPLILYPYQVKVVKAFHENRFALTMQGRQQGKSTCATAYLLWRAMFVPDSTVLIVANTYAQALELMERVRFAYENIPNTIRGGVTEFNKGNIGFDNGSRIISRATTPNAGRGLSISLLYADEFAFVAPNIQNSFWQAISPTLATGGGAIITSTPNNDEDMFAQLWKGAIDTTDDYGNPLPGGVGRNGFFAVKSPWWEHPDRDEAWAKPFRESLGPAKFAQEFECEFYSSDSTLINAMTLARMRSMEPAFYTGTIRWFKDPEPNRGHIVALDPSLGTGNDYAAIQVFQLPEMIQIAEWQHNKTDPRGQVRVLMQVLQALRGMQLESPEQQGEPEIFWSVENNSIGETILMTIQDTNEEKFPGVFISEKKRKGQPRGRFRKGLNTTNPKKLSACARLKSMIEGDRLVVNSKQLLKELKNFVHTGNSVKAKPGENDDLVSALLLCVRMIERVAGFLPEAESLLREGISEEEYSMEPMPVEF